MRELEAIERRIRYINAELRKCDDRDMGLMLKQELEILIKRKDKILAHELENAAYEESCKININKKPRLYECSPGTLKMAIVEIHQYESNRLGRHVITADDVLNLKIALELNENIFDLPIDSSCNTSYIT